MRRAGLVLACLAIFPLAGCIILPLPPVGAQIGREEIETLRPGSSTRQDVRATLGGPDQSLTDRYEIFEVDEETMYLFFGTYGFGDIVRIGGQDFRVLAEYGPDDVLQSLAWEARIANDGAGYQYMSSRVDAAALDDPFAGVAVPLAPRSSERHWSAPSFAGAVAASPKEPMVAIADEADFRRARTTLRNWQTGAFVSLLTGTPDGCPELLPPYWSYAGLVPMVFLSDGRHLASSAEEARVCVWDSATHHRLLVFEAHWKPRSFFGLEAGNRLTSIAAARSAAIVATADHHNTVRVWDGLSGREILSLEPCASGPGCGSWVATSLGRLVLSEDGRVLAFFQSGSQSDAVRFWDTTTGGELATLVPPGKTRARFALLITTALSPDQRRFALHMGDHLQIWRTPEDLSSLAAGGSSRPPATDFELEKAIIMPAVYSEMPGSSDEGDQYVRSLEFSADGRRLAAGGDGMIIAWDTETWRVLWRTRADRREPFAFVDNGQRIVSGCCVWRLPAAMDTGLPPPAS